MVVYINCDTPTERNGTERKMSTNGRAESVLTSQTSETFDYSMLATRHAAIAGCMSGCMPQNSYLKSYEIRL